MEWEPQGSRFPLKTRRSSQKIRAENTLHCLGRWGVPGDWSVSILGCRELTLKPWGLPPVSPLHCFPEARTPSPLEALGAG